MIDPDLAIDAPASALLRMEQDLAVDLALAAELGRRLGLDDGDLERLRARFSEALRAARDHELHPLRRVL